MISRESRMKHKLNKETKKMVGFRLSQTDIDRVDKLKANKSEFFRNTVLKEVDRIEKRNFKFSKKHGAFIDE